jgi:hypothetical protein
MEQEEPERSSSGKEIVRLLPPPPFLLSSFPVFAPRPCIYLLPYLFSSSFEFSKLSAVGMGETDLLDPSQPDDARNRRVRIRNLN